MRIAGTRSSWSRPHQPETSNLCRSSFPPPIRCIPRHRTGQTPLCSVALHIDRRLCSHFQAVLAPSVYTSGIERPRMAFLVLLLSRTLSRLTGQQLPTLEFDKPSRLHRSCCSDLILIQFTARPFRQVEIVPLCVFTRMVTSAFGK